MSETKSILFQLKFVDLLNKSFPNLYHEIRETGKVISANTSDAQGLGTGISRPPGTILIVHIRHPLTKKMIVIKSYIKVPDKKGTFTIKAPFSIQTVKLRALNETIGDYLRKTHIVKPDETLSSIAQTYGVNWQQIAQLNNLKEPYTIQLEDVLKLPPKKSRQQSTSQSNSSNSPQTSDIKVATTYEVKENETLSGISQRSGVSVEQIQRMNGISRPETLQAGQTIKLRGDGSAQYHTTSKPTASNSNEEGFFDSVADDLESIGESIKEGFEDFNNAISGTKEGESSDSPRPFPSKSTKRKNNEESNNSNSDNSSQSKQPSNPIKTQASEDRGQTGTAKVDVTKLGDCSCNRDLTLSELEEMILQLRGGSNIEVFNHSKCTLDSSERNTQSLLTELNKVFKKYEMSTCIRRIHFLAQLYHESAHLSTTTEFADGTYYNPPNPSRKTHPDAVKNGNTKMGDGPKYRGRGLIQITWKNNYKLYKNYSNIDVVNDSTLISNSLALSCNVSGWFWTQGKILASGKEWRGYPKKHITDNGNNYHTINMNVIADDTNKTDAENTTTITYLVNGGDNGLKDRKKNVETLKIIFGYPSQCISTGVQRPENSTSASGAWHEPIKNPMCTLYMQSGGGGFTGEHWGLFGNTRNGSVHQGVDLFAPIKTEVHACVKAIVHKIEKHSGYGQTVTLKVVNKDDFYNHRRNYDLKYKSQGEIIQGPNFDKKDDIFFFYAHLGKVLVEEEMEVEAGKVIATSGVSGIRNGTCAPHLHFEIFTTVYAVGMGLKYRCNPGFYVHYKTADEMSNAEKMLQENAAKTRYK